MKSMKEFIKTNLRLILYVLFGALVITGMLIVIFGAGDNQGFLAVMMMVFGIVLILLGCSLAIYSCFVKTNEPVNYFLYDSKKRANLSVDELTFDIINKKMTVVMADLASSAAKVWTEDVFEARKDVFETDAVYIPLVAYKMLYDLADRADSSIWSLYLMAPASLIDSVAHALDLNSDSQMGDAFKILHKKADGSYERTEKFLTDNKTYIQNKMVKYVKTNISKF